MATKSVGALVIAAGILASLGAAAALPAAAPLRPGTYAGSVRMAVAVGKGRLPATLTGTWTMRVDRAGHVRGSADMKGPVRFPSPDSDGCTYSPVTWTLGAKGTFGTSYSGSGSPGVVRGSAVLVDVWQSWYTRPAGYDRTCGGNTQPWPFVVVLGGGGDTVTPIQATLRLPIGLFTSRGHAYTVRFTTTWKRSYTQTYTLASAPGR